MVKPSLKTRLGIELIALAILTTIFLVLFPRRPIFVDESLALFALLLLAVNVKFTRNVVWAQFPPPASKRHRLRKCLALVMAMTFSLVLVLLAAGIAIGYSESGWDTAFNRVCNWRILIAISLYFPWGLLQQTLFQFYLLGRLRTLLPSSTGDNLYRSRLRLGSPSRSLGHASHRSHRGLLDLPVPQVPPTDPFSPISGHPGRHLLLLDLR